MLVRHFPLIPEKPKLINRNILRAEKLFNLSWLATTQRRSKLSEHPDHSSSTQGQDIQENYFEWHRSIKSARHPGTVEFAG